MARKNTPAVASKPARVIPAGIQRIAYPGIAGGVKLAASPADFDINKHLSLTPDNFSSKAAYYDHRKDVALAYVARYQAIAIDFDNKGKALRSKGADRIAKLEAELAALRGAPQA